MAEYIERIAAVDAVTDAIWHGKRSMNDVASAINSVPSADVAPVRHGRWIVKGYVCGETEYQCSECKEMEWRTSASRLKYCPFCGAKMDRGAD